jgi:single-stranded-DNA-specific exonuclease
VKPKSVSAGTIAFTLAPRLNAAGRLDDARLGLDLVMTSDEHEAMSLATRLNDLNRERQRLTREAELLAQELVQERGQLPITIVGHEDLHKGIVGLVASRLVELLGRPAAVFQRESLESRGSCRSIPEYDIVAGLRSCGDLFERFGGHRAAAGFTLRNDRLREFDQRLTEHAARELEGIDLTPALEVDAEWALAQVRGQEIKFLERVGPFGKDNPRVTLLSRNVLVCEASARGADGRHLRMKLKDGNVTWPAIAFGMGEFVPAVGARIDVVYSIDDDRYGPDMGGSTPLQLHVEDFAIA